MKFFLMLDVFPFPFPLNDSLVEFLIYLVWLLFWIWAFLESFFLD